MKVKDIKKKVKENGYEEWKNGMEGKSTLRWYKSKTNIKKEDWYKGNWGGKLLFKARSGTLEVNGRKREMNEQGCKFCEEEKETLEHFIIECDKFRTQRQELEEKISDILGREMWETRKQGDDRGLKTVLGLTGDKDTDKTVVRHTMKFLVESWRRREEV